MKNIIEELWNGEINPQDTLVDNNPHYKELQHLQGLQPQLLSFDLINYHFNTKQTSRHKEFIENRSIYAFSFLPF